AGIEPGRERLIAVEAGAERAVGVGPDALPMLIDEGRAGLPDVEAGVGWWKIVELVRAVALPAEADAHRGLEAGFVAVESRAADVILPRAGAGRVRQQIQHGAVVEVERAGRRGAQAVEARRRDQREV